MASQGRTRAGQEQGRSRNRVGAVQEQSTSRVGVVAEQELSRRRGRSRSRAEGWQE